MSSTDLTISDLEYKYYSERTGIVDGSLADVKYAYFSGIADGTIRVISGAEYVALEARVAALEGGV